MIGRVRQTIDCQAQIRKNFIVDDVVEEYGIRIERFFSQNDTIGECLVVADGTALIDVYPYFKGAFKLVL